MGSSFDGYTIVQAADLCQYHKDRAMSERGARTLQAR
jgi:hypothetical protein